MIVHILIVNTAFYIHGNIRLKEISILNWFEQIQENIIAGSAFSARLGSAARPWLSYPTPMKFGTFVPYMYHFVIIVKYLTNFFKLE